MLKSTVAILARQFVSPTAPQIPSSTHLLPKLTKTFLITGGTPKERAQKLRDIRRNDTTHWIKIFQNHENTELVVACARNGNQIPNMTFEQAKQCAGKKSLDADIDFTTSDSNAPANGIINLSAPAPMLRSSRFGNAV